MGYMERYEEWLKKLPEDHPFHAELFAIKGDDAEIKDRFYNAGNRQLYFELRRGCEPGICAGL